eukprot:3937249-Rhodomonas_salina.2
MLGPLFDSAIQKDARREWAGLRQRGSVRRAGAQTAAQDPPPRLPVRCVRGGAEEQPGHAQRRHRAGRRRVGHQVTPPEDPEGGGTAFDYGPYAYLRSCAWTGIRVWRYQPACTETRMDLRPDKVYGGSRVTALTLVVTDPRCH